MANKSLERQRQSIQEYITSIESRLRWRLLRKLIAAGWFDVDDILNSMRRRVDHMLHKGTFPTFLGSRLDSYINGVAHKIALEKGRKHRRMVRLEQLVAGRAGAFTELIDGIELSNALESAFGHLRQADREMLEKWAQGLSPERIAEMLGISHQAYKTRRRRLLELICRSHCNSNCEMFAARRAQIDAEAESLVAARVIYD